jgi:hypothetical protein
MQDSEIVKRYAEHFVESLPDAVTFAKDYLGFQPFGYQEEFLRDQSPLSAGCCGWCKNARCENLSCRVDQLREVQ